jgi:hypothetical protein
VTLLLPLLRLAAAAPAAQVQHLAQQLLQLRLLPFCGNSNSSSSSNGNGMAEAALWLQHLPQLWSAIEVCAVECSIAASSRGSTDVRGAVYQVMLGKTHMPAAAAAAAGGGGGGGRAPDDSTLDESSSACVISDCVDVSWLTAQTAVLSFVAEALAAVERKPQEPWELLQAALRPHTAATAAAAGGGGGGGGGSASGPTVSSSTPQPSMFAVCALRRLLRLLKSSKAAAAVKAAVCGYVCGVWQDLLQQQLDQSAAVAVLTYLLQEEGKDWAAPEGTRLQITATTAAAAAVAAAGVEGIQGEGSTEGVSSKHKRHKRDSKQQAAAVAATPDSQQQQQQQQQQAATVLLLPPEASFLVSLYSTAVNLQAAASNVLLAQQLQQQQLYNTPSAAAAAGAGVDPGPGLDGSQQSSKKKRKRAAEQASAAGGSTALQHWLTTFPQLHLQLAPAGGSAAAVTATAQQLLQALSGDGAPATQLHAAAAGSTGKKGKKQAAAAASASAAAAENAGANTPATARLWQQLQLSLLACPAAQVAAAADVSNLLVSQQQQQQQASPMHVQMLTAALTAHGLSWASIAAARSQDRDLWPAAAAALVAASQLDKATCIPAQQQQQQHGSCSLQLLRLQVASCLDCRSPAAPAAAAWVVAQEGTWRGHLLLQLQQLPLQAKLQLLQPIVCGWVRLTAAAAAAAAAGHTSGHHTSGGHTSGGHTYDVAAADQQQGPADLLFTFATQMLQALLCHSAGSGSGNHSSSSTAACDVSVCAPVLQQLLQQPVLLLLFADSSPAAAAAGSQQLTKQLLVLLTWLLHCSTADTPIPPSAAAAAAAAASTGGGVTATGDAVVAACIPFVQKALDQVQEELAMQSAANAAAVQQQAVHAAQHAAAGDTEEPSLAAAVLLQLLPALTSIPDSSSSSRDRHIQGGVLLALQQLISSLLPVDPAVPSGDESNRVPLPPCDTSSSSSKRRKQQQSSSGPAAAAAAAAAALHPWQMELLLTAAHAILQLEQQQQQVHCMLPQQQDMSAAAAVGTSEGWPTLPKKLVQYLVNAWVGRHSTQVDAFWAAALASTYSHAPPTFPPTQGLVLAAAGGAAADLQAACGNIVTGASGAHQLPFLSPADCLGLLKASLQQPLTPTRAAVAAALLQGYSTETHYSPQQQEHQQQQLCSCFSEGLQQCLAAVTAETGDAPPAAAAAGLARRETLALLLPAAAAYLARILHNLTDQPAASQQQEQQQQQEQAGQDPVVAGYRPALLAFVQLKPKQKGKPLSQQQQQQDSSGPGLSAAAAVQLQRYVVPVLQYCLQQQPLDGPTLGKLLQKLLPAAGYQLHAIPTAAAAAAVAGGSAGAGLGSSRGGSVDPVCVATASTDHPQPWQQVHVASWLLQQQAAAAAAIADTTIQQQQQPALLQHVSLFVVCACKTLCNLHKQQQQRQQQQQQNPTPGVSDQASTPQGMEALLLQQLDSWAGDVLADLPDHLRITAATAANHEANGSGLWIHRGPAAATAAAAEAAATYASAEAYAAIIAAVQQLALSVLKHRFGDSSSMRCLRRLLAALLPGSISRQEPADSDQALEADTTAADGTATAAAVHLNAPGQQQQQQEGSSSDTSSAREYPPGRGDKGDGTAGGSDSGSDSEASHEHPATGADHTVAAGQQRVKRHKPSSSNSSSSSDASSSDDATSSSDAGSDPMQAEHSDASTDEQDDADTNPTAAAAAEEAFADQDLAQDDADSTAIMRVYNPAAAAAAQGLLQLLVSHSGFVPALLPQQQQQQQVLPEAVCAVATPLSSYMPVVQAVWASEDSTADTAAAAHHTSSSCSSSSSSGGSSGSSGGDSSQDSFRCQLVLLLEVLLDMCKLYTSKQQQQQQDTDSMDSGDSGPAAASAAVDAASLGLSPDLLQSLLQLLQVAYSATLSDADRATLRVLLQLDALLPSTTHQQPSSSSSDERSGDGEAPAEQQQYPLQWPRCLFGTAAKLYYEHVHLQRKQQQQGASAVSNGPTPAAAAAAAAVGANAAGVDVKFVQQLLQETCPLEPLQCALTVALFPDRRCLNPDYEPGNALVDLYYSTTTTTTTSSSSSSCRSGSVGGSPTTSSSSSSGIVGPILDVCAGAAASAAAAAYDPVPLLLLGLRGLQQGYLDVDSFAVCGLLGVVLRALAAEDLQLRTLAYDCLALLTADSACQPGSDQTLDKGLVRGGAGSLPGQTLDGHQNNLGQAGKGSGSFGSIQQLLRSSKRVHQMRALLLWVTAGVTSPQQQLPTASAALAAEASLLLCAPHHPMGAVLRKLMVRQRALDTKGLPLFGRILALSGSSSSNADSSRGAGRGQGGLSERSRAGGEASAAAAGLRGAAAVMAERQWLLQLLWMGLRVSQFCRGCFHELGRCVLHAVCYLLLLLSCAACMPCSCLLWCCMLHAACTALLYHPAVPPC